MGYVKNLRQDPTGDENPDEIHFTKVFYPEANNHDKSEPVQQILLNSIK